MKHILSVFVAMSVALFLFSCSGGSRDEKLIKELEGQGWTGTEEVLMIEWGDSTYEYQIASTKLTKHWITDQTLQIDAYIDIYLNTGEVSVNADLDYSGIDITVTGTGNIYTDIYEYETTDDGTYDEMFNTQIDLAYAFILSIIEEAGFTIDDFKTA